MKRTFMIFISLIAVNFLLIACQPNTSSNNLTDGSYKVTYDKADSRDWKAFLTLDIEEGKIKNVNFDYDGTGQNKNKLKTEDKAYNEAMKSATGTNPANYTVLLSKSLEESQDVSKIDTISGATTSSNTFELFAKEAVKAAKKGNTETIIVKQDE